MAESSAIQMAISRARFPNRSYAKISYPLGYY